MMFLALWLLGCGGGIDAAIQEIDVHAEAVCACDTVECADEKWRPLTKINLEYGAPDYQAGLSEERKRRYEEGFERARACKQKLTLGQK